MKKAIRLLSVQLWAVLGDMLSIGGTRKKKPKVLYVGVLFFVLLMSAVSFFYSLMIGSGLKYFDSLELLPAMMMAVACIIIFFTTIFKVKGTIFGFRDYDLIMSLPVSTGAVVACRLLILYAFNFMFVIIMVIPMMVAYGILAQPEVAFYLICFIVMFFIPLVPIVLSSILGTLIAYIASKFRHSNLLNIILSAGLLMAVIGSSFLIKDNGQELVDMGKALTNEINGMYPLAQMYTDAVIHYDIVSLLMFLGISIAAFALYTFVVMKVFKKMNTLIMTGSYHRNFKMGELKTSSPFKALYIKEIRRYFSSTLYVLNTGFGIVMLTVGAIAILFVDLGKALGDPQAVTAIADNGPLYITFCVIMTSTTMASISLEGKSLWIIRSMPVTPQMVFLSKIAVNLTILSPAVIDALLIGIGLKLGVLKTLLLLLTTIASSVFISFYGLLINLMLPNFSWTAEVVVIKQSAACMVTIFSAMAYVAVQFAFLFFIPNYLLAYLGYLLLTIVLDAVLYLLVMNYGSKRYATF
jgi:ABC-2 type transport system permease protein